MTHHLLYFVLLLVGLVSGARVAPHYPIYGDGRCETEILPISEDSLPEGARIDGKYSPSGNIFFTELKTLEECSQLCEAEEWCVFYSLQAFRKGRPRGRCYISADCNLVNTRDNGFDNASNTYTTYFKLRVSIGGRGYEYMGDGYCADSDRKPLYSYWQSGSSDMNPSKCAAICSQHSFCRGIGLDELDPTYCSLESFAESHEYRVSGFAGFTGRWPIGVGNAGTSIQQALVRGNGQDSRLCYKKAACYVREANMKRCSRGSAVERFTVTDASECRALAFKRGHSFFAYNIDNQRCEVGKNTAAGSVSCELDNARTVKNEDWYLFRVDTQSSHCYVEDCDRNSRDVEECGRCFFDEQCVDGHYCHSLGVCMEYIHEPEDCLHGNIPDNNFSLCSGKCDPLQDWFPLSCNCEHPDFPANWMDQCSFSGISGTTRRRLMALNTKF